MTSVTATPTHHETGAIRAALPQLAPFLGILALAIVLPFVSNDYWALIGTRAAIYWVLVSGLNLVVGFAGHLAIGYVALLTLGAYTTSVLVAGNVMPLCPLPALSARCSA
jgi:ABC-type branched-subunit amino acid transport system permease subunit